MYTCTEPDCQNKNIWTISSDNTSPPFYESFNLCHRHLENETRFREMHNALAMGRFNKQSGNTVNFNGWTLEKIVATWKRRKIECSECDRTDKIWQQVKWVHDEYDCYPNGYYQGTCLCDGHLPRKSLGENPRIGGHYSGGGLSPVEVTWVKKARVEKTSSKKRKESEEAKIAQHKPKKSKQTKKVH